MEKLNILDINTSTVLDIIVRNPFMFKDYLILDHKDNEIDIGLKEFWLHIDVNELSVLRRYTVTADKQFLNGYLPYHQKHILIGKLKNVWTKDIIDEFSYSEYFRYVFDTYKNSDEYKKGMEHKLFIWEYRKEEEERRRFHKEGHIPMGVRLNPPKKII